MADEQRDKRRARKEALPEKTTPDEDRKIPPVPWQDRGHLRLPRQRMKRAAEPRKKV